MMSWSFSSQFINCLKVKKKDNKTVQKPWNDMILQMHVDKYVFSKRIMCTITKVGYKFGYYFSQ